jgi:hypothetical protein
MQGVLGIWEGEARLPVNRNRRENILCGGILSRPARDVFGVFELSKKFDF